VPTHNKIPSTDYHDNLFTGCVGVAGVFTRRAGASGNGGSVVVLERTWTTCPSSTCL